MPDTIPVRQIAIATGATEMRDETAAGRGFCSGPLPACLFFCCWPRAQAFVASLRRQGRAAPARRRRASGRALCARTVRRDAHGVPHIDAATQEDMLVAQGYVTAQDRLWQMDSLRRSANGELAEILGPALVKQDKTQRVLQIRLTAQRIYDHLPAADRARLDAYARGVNLFIAQCEQSHTLPVEFRLLMYRPQPWSGVDSISVGLAMVQELDTHAVTKLSRARVAAQLNDPQLEADLYPVGSWRDRPPTGIKVDLSEPQPLPPPSKKNEDEDDDDENTETRAVPGSAPISSGL